jgi:hypothetical protein
MFDNYADEVWAPIHDYPKYEVSTYGRVWSHRTKIFLKQKVNRGGYLIVNLYNNCGMSTKTVHGLVKNAFIHLDDPNLQIDHQDGDKTYNDIRNLEPVTSKENHRRAFEMGLRDSRFGPQPVRCLETGDEFESIADAAKATGCHSGNIAGVLRRRSKYTNGYSFELIEIERR